jgi:hypothetical protein
LKLNQDTSKEKINKQKTYTIQVQKKGKDKETKHIESHSNFDTVPRNSDIQLNNRIVRNKKKKLNHKKSNILFIGDTCIVISKQKNFNNLLRGSLTSRQNTLSENDDINNNYVLTPRDNEGKINQENKQLNKSCSVKANTFKNEIGIGNSQPKIFGNLKNIKKIQFNNNEKISISEYQNKERNTNTPGNINYSNLNRSSINVSITPANSNNEVNNYNYMANKQVQIPNNSLNLHLDTNFDIPETKINTIYQNELFHDSILGNFLYNQNISYQNLSNIISQPNTNNYNPTFTMPNNYIPQNMLTQNITQNNIQLNPIPNNTVIGNILIKNGKAYYMNQPMNNSLNNVPYIQSSNGICFHNFINNNGIIANNINLINSKSKRRQIIKRKKIHLSSNSQKLLINRQNHSPTLQHKIERKRPVIAVPIFKRRNSSQNMSLNFIRKYYDENFILEDDDEEKIEDKKSIKISKLQID